MSLTAAVAHKPKHLTLARISGNGLKPVAELVQTKPAVVLEREAAVARLARIHLATTTVARIPYADPLQMCRAISTALPLALAQLSPLIDQIMVYAFEEFAKPTLPMTPSMGGNQILEFAHLFKREIRVGRKLLTDLGGEYVSLRTGYTAASQIQGFYLHPDLFRSAKPSALEKWKSLFQGILAGLAPQLSVTPGGAGIGGLFGLPPETSQLEFTTPSGVVVCPDDFFELHPDHLVMHLMRRQHVFVFNYDTSQPCVESFCLDAFYATKWLQQRLKCRNNQLTVVGRGVGAGPAAFVAASPYFTDITNIRLVLDTPRADGACPMNDLVQQAKGRKLQVENDPNFQAKLNQFYLS